MLRVSKTARVSDGTGFKKVFAPGRLTLGVFFPAEAFERSEATMSCQICRQLVAFLILLLSESAVEWRV